MQIEKKLVLHDH